MRSQRQSEPFPSNPLYHLPTPPPFPSRHFPPPFGLRASAHESCRYVYASEERKTDQRFFIPLAGRWERAAEAQRSVPLSLPTTAKRRAPTAHLVQGNAKEEGSIAPTANTPEFVGHCHRGDARVYRTRDTQATHTLSPTLTSSTRGAAAPVAAGVTGCNQNANM